MKKLLITALTCSTALLAAPAMAESTNELVVPIYEANANDDGDKVGNVHITMTEYGALFIPALEDVKSGVYGFHVHANGDCSAKEDDDGKMVPALAAGGHWDPDNTEQHKGPWDNSGHKGDLPALAIEGDESYPVLAPKITDLKELKGQSLMIHEGGDNYSDSPKPLGGGGDRMLCGVIE